MADDEDSETSATLEVKKKVNGKTDLHVLKEQKSKSPSKEMLKRFPYIRKNPCIRRIMVAIHELNYQIEKPSECKEEKCLFCKYHVEKMMNEKYNDQAAPPVCEAVNVVFLLYCINCDEVLLGFTCDKFKLLADISFGFHWGEQCERGECHEKRYVRCMMIDQLQNLGNKTGGTLISMMMQLKNYKFSIGKIIDQSVDHIALYTITKFDERKRVHCEARSHLTTLDKYLHLNKCLILKKYKKGYLRCTEKVPCTDVLIVDDEWEVHRQYHYIPRSSVKKFGPNAHTFPLESENIVYLRICHNCNIMYVGRTEDTYLSDTSSVDSHFIGGECTARDYRWSVIDRLSDDQISFLGKWEKVFNACKINAQKKIWSVMELDENTALKDALIETVWTIKSSEDIIKHVENLDKVVENWKVANDDEEAFLINENEKWIKNTKTLFIAEREHYWITQLQTLENGLNEIGSSTPNNCSPNLYNEFFKRMN